MADFFFMRAALVGGLGLSLVGCGSIVYLDDDGSGATSSSSTTATSSGATSSSASSGTGGGGGGAPGCPTADGVVVVGCGLHSNAVVLDGDEGALYVLDAEEGNAAFFETLWRLDLATYTRTALYEGISFASPLERTQSFARSNDAFYVATVQDEEIILRVPLDGGPATPIVPGGVKPGAHVAAYPFIPGRVYFESSEGISRVDPMGNVALVSTLQGTLFGASSQGAAVAFGGSTHLVEEGGDTYYGPIDAFGAAHAHLRDSLLLVPTDAGIGGIHEILGYYPDSDFTQAQVPDGEGGGPPRFVRQVTIGGEINVLLFVQGTANAGLAFMWAGEQVSGLFGEKPPLGGGHVVRGPAIMVDNVVYAASARATDGGNGALEGTIVQLE